MDISNYTVKTIMLEVDFVNSQSTAVVELSQEVVDGVFQQIGTYTISLPTAYSNQDDPDLLADIVEKLESLPD